MLLCIYSMDSWLLAFAVVYVATDFLVFIVVLLRIPNPQPNRRILPKSV